MATLTVRDLDEELKARLRVRAARHGRSMEAEVRAILDAALRTSSAPAGLGSRIHDLFAGAGGAELALPSREEAARGADLEA